MKLYAQNQDPLILAKFTSKIKETHLNYALPFPAMDEALLSNRSSNLAEIPSGKDYGSICME